MLRAETCHPAELAQADAGAWRELCAGRPEFASPLLGPDFARAVGEVRADARVAVWRWNDKPVGFLAYHRRPGGFARPIGAPLSDYHAVVSCGALDMPRALAAAGLSAYRFTGLVDPLHAFKAAVATRPEAYVIQLESDAEAYLEALRAASPKRFKNYRRLDHKLDREVGALAVVAPDPSQDAFDKLIAWKREQLARTGVHDFLAPDWTRGLMRTLFQRRDGDFQGLMVNLYAGGRLVAGHFGVRLGDVYHPWIASTDPELAAWSPGQVFLLRTVAAMPGLGLRTYDLGPGHDHYKRPYALTTRTVGEGLIGAASPAGRTAQAAQAAWTLAGADGAGLAGRLRRRLDAIATTELTLAGRALGLASALAARARRPGGAAEPA
jgi:CelD/BcsL family acetyltransferase involved in cellulose biosynthesis